MQNVIDGAGQLVAVGGRSDQQSALR